MDHLIWTPYPPGDEWAFAEDTPGLRAEHERGLVAGGTSLTGEVTTIDVAVSEGTVADVVGTVWGGWLVSPAARSAIDAVGAQVEWLPVELHSSGIEPYCLLNPLQVVDALDVAASSLEMVPGSQVVRSARRLVLAPGAGGFPPLSVVVGLYGVLLVSIALRTELEQACEAPGLFVEVSNYRHGLV